MNNHDHAYSDIAPIGGLSDCQKNGICEFIQDLVNKTLLTEAEITKKICEHFSTSDWKNLPESSHTPILQLLIAIDEHEKKTLCHIPFYVSKNAQYLVKIVDHQIEVLELYTNNVRWFNGLDLMKKQEVQS